MFRFMVLRVLQVIPVLFGIAILVFSMLHLIPGDPALLVVGIEAPKETLEMARENLGLNKPLFEQFVTFMGNVGQGDLGTSIKSGIPVREEIASRFLVTIKIALGATIFATFFGMLSGILAAIKQNKATDNFIMVISLIGISMPSYFLGLLLMIAFSLKLSWFPSFGIDTPMHYVLPIVTLGVQAMGEISRMTRSSMLDVVRQDYIRTAQAKGLPENVITFIHALKNALIPVITVVGLRFGVLMSGTILVEVVFSVPGLGSYLVDAILVRDYPVVQGSILVIASSFVIINIIVDIVYKLADPRIRYD